MKRFVLIIFLFPATSASNFEFPCKNVLNLELSLAGMGSTDHFNDGVKRSAYRKASSSIMYSSEVNATTITQFGFHPDNLGGNGVIVTSSSDVLGNKIEKKILLTAGCTIKKVIITTSENKKSTNLRFRTCQKVKPRYSQICKTYELFFDDRPIASNHKMINHRSGGK